MSESLSSKERLQVDDEIDSIDLSMEGLLLVDLGN